MKKTYALLTLLIFYTCSAAAEDPGFEVLQANIYRLQDACNVYLPRSGSSGILIDAGSDRLAGALKSIGVEQIDWVLHTHYHLDQCLGSAGLKNTGTKTAIGKADASYLQTANIKSPVNLSDRYLLNDELSNYGRRIEPFQKPGVNLSLKGGDEIKWNEYTIRIIDTPGHTKGSVSYMVEVDGRGFCFSGDLVTTDVITALLPPGHAETGFNPYWTTFYPVKETMVPGERKQVVLRINNSAGHPVSGKAWVKSHDDIIFPVKEFSYDIGPGEKGEIPVEMKIKADCRPGTYIITADIEFDNEFYGEYPQGYILIDE